MRTPNFARHGPTRAGETLLLCIAVSRSLLARRCSHVVDQRLGVGLPLVSGGPPRNRDSLRPLRACFRPSTGSPHIANVSLILRVR
jgi:hypothetical protein